MFTLPGEEGLPYSSCLGFSLLGEEGLPLPSDKPSKRAVTTVNRGKTGHNL